MDGTQPYLDKSDQELVIEMERIQETLRVRKEERVRAQKQERLSLSEDWMTNLDAMIAMAPPHLFGDCAQKGPSMGTECGLCSLLAIKNSGYWDQDYRLDINVVHDPVEGEGLY